MGKKTGKGKEYGLNGKLKSESEYYENSELKFEGIYKNGRRNGKGYLFNYLGKLKFEGMYLDKKIKGILHDYGNKYKLD